MICRFRDRAEAGRLLAGKLLAYANRPDVIVLALPRGGVPVAYEVAKALQCPLDVFVVRKLGVPGEEELAMGAIASGGVHVVNESVRREFGISAAEMETVAQQETRELLRREAAYRGGRPPLDVRGRIVILVDDGIATGTTMRAAICALRRQHVLRLAAAAAVASRQAFDLLAEDADEMVCVSVPEDLNSISMWFEDFRQTTDEEVNGLLCSP